MSTEKDTTHLEILYRSTPTQKRLLLVSVNRMKRPTPTNLLSYSYILYTPTPLYFIILDC